MRLLQVAEALHPSFGGIAEGVFQQSLELQKRGWEMEALSCEEQDVPRLPEHGIPHHRFAPDKARWRQSAQTEEWVAENIQRFDAVLLNGLWMHPMWAAGKAARESRVPYMVMPHGMLDPYFLQGLKKSAIKRTYWKMYEGKTFCSAARLLFTAEEELKLAAANYPIEEEKARIIGYGIADPQAPQAAAERSRDLLFMSRVDEKKGLDLAVRALAMTDRRLLIAGRNDNDYARQMKALASEVGVADRVKWLGFISGDRKRDLLASCAAMILPSHQENFGIIVAESLAFSLPVIISRRVNIWREVEQAEAGLVCDDNADSAADAVSRFDALIAEQRQQMGARGAALFHDRFTMSASVDRLMPILEEITS